MTLIYLRHQMQPQQNMSDLTAKNFDSSFKVMPNNDKNQAAFSKSNNQFNRLLSPNRKFDNLLGN